MQFSIKKSQISQIFNRFLQKIIEIFDANDYKMSPFLSNLCIFFYFTHLANYLYQITPNAYEISYNTLKNIFFYMNFHNILIFLDNEVITTVCYYIMILLILWPYIILFPLIMITISFKKTKILRKLEKLKLFFTQYLIFHYWLLFIPFNDFLIYSMKTMKNLYFISLLCLLLNISSLFLNASLNRRYNFIEKNFKIAYNFPLLLTILLRIFISLSFNYINSQSLLHILSHLFSLSSISNILKFPPISQIPLLFYIICLFSYACHAILLSFENPAGFLNNDGNFFYFTIILIVLCIKLAKWVYITLYRQKFYMGKIGVEVLEEIYGLANEKKAKGILKGFLLNHFKHCKDEKCVHLKKFKENLDEKVFVDRFIRLKFERLGEKLLKNEEIIIKFITFLIKIDYNPIKCYYDLQMLENRLNKNSMNSQYFIALFHVLKVKILDKIRNLAQNSKKTENYDKEVNSRDYFETTTYMERYEICLKTLLKQKIEFWEKYIDGFSSMGELLEIINKVTFHINTFINEILAYKSMNNVSSNIMKMKILGISHSILTNKLHLSIKFQENCENLLRIYDLEDLRISEKTLKHSSFMDPDLATCQVSYLNNRGNFLKHSKNDEKFARFFGYSTQEFQIFESISGIMPKIIEKNHNKFFMNFLNKSRLEIEEKQRNIETYALTKEQFIIPVKIFVGFNLSIHEDFVLSAAFLKHSCEKSLWMFDNYGNTQGFSAKLYDFFMKNSKISSKQDIFLLNILPIIPKIKVLMERIDEKEGIFIKNQIGFLNLPESMLDMLNILREKQDEDHEYEKYQSISKNLTFRSNKTFVSNHSNNTHNSKRKHKFLNNLTKTYNIPENLHDSLIDKTKENGFSNHDIISLIFSKTTLKKCYISFDFRVHAYRFGSGKNDILRVFIVEFKRIDDNGQSLTQTNNNEEYSHEKSEEIIKEVEIIKSDDNIKIKNVENINYEIDKNFLVSRPHLDTLVSDHEPIANLPEENPINFLQIFTRGDEKSSNSANISQISNENPENTRNIQFFNNSLIKAEIGFIQKYIANITIPQNEEIMVKPQNEVFLENSSKNEKFNQEKTDDLRRTKNLIQPENSLHTSSLSSIKKTFLIYDTVDRIQSKRPTGLKRLLVVLLMEILLILVYCISLYYVYQAYIEGSYKPVQQTLINFCKMMGGIQLSTLIMSEVEYSNLGFVANSPTKFQISMFPVILNNTFVNVKNLAYEMRNNQANLAYESLYKSLDTSYVEQSNLFSVKFVDLLDLYIETVHGFVESEDIFNKNYEEIIIFQRNYPYYLSGAVVLSTLQNEFLNSNQNTTNIVLTLMIVFLCINAFLKVFELFEMMRFHKLLTFLMNIFRRVSVKEAEGELKFLSEVNNLMNKPFIHLNFLDKYLNREFDENEKNEKNEKNDKSEMNEKNEKNEKNDKNDKNEKNEKNEKNHILTKRMFEKKHKMKVFVEKPKVSFYNFKQMSTMKIYLLLLTISGVSFSFFYFNYFFWITNNQNISTLIQINTFFENLYIYSTSILGFSTLFLRETIIRNLDYEASNEFYQQHQNRLNYCYNNFLKRYYVVGNITSNYMIQYTLEAQTNLKDNDFNIIVGGDICVYLLKMGILDSDNQDICESFLNGAFKKGILNVMNEYLREISLFTNFQSFLDNSSINREEAINFINQKEYRDLLNSHYFLTKTLLSYYENINNYYQGIMDNQMSNLNLFLILTSIFFGLVFLIVSLLLYCGLLKFYKNVSLNLNMIPYDRLTSDEQTKFLIKQFLKKLN